MNDTNLWSLKAGTNAHILQAGSKEEPFRYRIEVGKYSAITHVQWGEGDGKHLDLQPGTKTDLYASRLAIYNNEETLAYGTFKAL